MLETKVLFNGNLISIDIILWNKGDPFPEIGDAVGIDTETELITDSELTPPLVITGVYIPETSKCYMIDWINTPYFMEELLKRDVTLYFANIGFDYFELYSKELRTHVNQGKVIDLFIRAALYEIATEGYISTYSLVDACKKYLNYFMDKHEDQGDEAARVTFRRNTPVSDEQLQYLAIDASSTYFACNKIPPQATEVTHTKGAICLYQITKNGIPYDPYMFDYCENLLKSDMDKYRDELLSYGYPDPYKKKLKAETKIENVWEKEFVEYIDSYFPKVYKVPASVPNKQTLKRMLIYGYNFLVVSPERNNMARLMLTIVIQSKKALVKSEKALWDKISSEYEFLDPCDACRKKEVFPLIVLKFLQLIKNEDLTVSDVFDSLQEFVEEHAEWFTAQEEVKPKAFLQEKLIQLEKDYKGLTFDRTPKSGELKCSKTDGWMLEDSNVKDPFITSYNNFVHVQKYLSTFVNRSHLRSDGRVRGRFGIVATGRTCCSGPNLQQYPSRDKQYPLKNMYRAPEGMVFVATDYSFAELVALAQCCITKYKHSVLAEIINADVCPHYFFAGVMLGLIEPDVSFCKDPAEVERVTKFLEENVSKEQRNKAKALNFGF